MKKENKKEYVRHIPKEKTLNKTDKKLYKELERSFRYVADLTNVIEEKTMDPSIKDLTLSEIHVLESVDKFNGKKMSLVAHDLNVTIGSLITCVNRLVKKGYLEKGSVENDARVTTLSVTNEAKRVLKLHDKFHHDILYTLMEKVSLANSVKVMTSLEQILEDYMYPKELAKKQVKKVKKNAK